MTEQQAERMRRVEVRPGEIVLVEVPRPEPGPAEALVETVVTGVCGSDTHAAAGHHPFVPLPYHPGHEVVGVVRAVGAEVTGVAVGDRVTVEPTLPCWSCKMCRTGRQNLCENLVFFGCGYEQGGMADFFTVPANRLHTLPPGMSDLEAALIEPLSTPVHAVALAGDPVTGLEGRAVVIIGAGTIGLLVLAAARHAGADRVVMTDLLPSKRERALRLGADAVVDAGRPDVVAAVRAELGESADVVFDCVSVQPTVDQALAMADKAGTVVIVGVPTRPVTVPAPIVQDHQLRIQGSATYLPADYRVAADMISAGEVRAADFVTSRYPLERVAEAFAASAGGEEVKVLVVRDPALVDSPL
ncbi:2-desacetyl-2-hydroxyethyl bacteriochlorophyllide A dehydrogenase [Friedmanniella endophytica]|uniref:2-desacetyl-2-hydroxyethyl bacteriochlorophyllide A dehydrogenase n=1 Tax=Microlunatus kandeliicorticis TaxID=1759536 RepID=A0A7W3P5P9_9ACTN|nr:alcohol dehydrogenase catalytic domain-containing protein [Microlunatus kandeliicorticis]MBA8794204.1 2-desacetyl-2-hydroxyethyl bacteriochlorophyllide A dehydrogenase [Microlunatus kandeliicorticis]